MDLMNATFKDYQAQHETILPLKVKEGLTYAQVKVRQVATRIEESFQTPELVLRVCQVGVAILSYSPKIDYFLEIPKQLCKDAKNLTNVVKGVKSFDGILHFQFSWKVIVLNVSGMTLFIVSGLSLLERCKIVNGAALKGHFSAIPIFGSLPYGGLLSFSLVGLMGIVSLFSFEKKGKLEREEDRIVNDKLVFWKEPLNYFEIQDRQTKRDAKIEILKDEVNACETLIKEGKRAENRFKRNPKQKRQLMACRQALEELNLILQGRKEDLAKCVTRSTQWAAIEKNWSYISPQELEHLREAKQKKWEAKLDKIEQEKKMNMISITNNIIILSRQVLMIVGVATGYGVVVLPLLVSIGLDTVSAGCGITTYFMKKSIKKIKIPPVNVTQYVNLNFTQTAVQAFGG